MLDTLWTLLPFLASAALLIIWAATILVAAVGWVIGRFQAGKAVSAAVALLMLVTLPVGSWLLGRSFFNKEVFQKADSKLDVLSGMVDRLFGGEDAGPAPEADSAPAQRPEDTSDEDLLALARQACPEMLRLDARRVTGELLPHGEELLPVSGAEFPEGFLVEGYESLEQLQEALDAAWYGSFAHIEGQEAPYLENMYLYAEADGAVYVQQGGIGGPEFTPVVDGMAAREGAVAYFSGHWEETPEEGFRFSLVFEDGRWKYGEVDLPG